MSERQPATFLVLIETQRQRWYAAAADVAGQAIPLMRSENGNLDAYVGLEFDEQISFLRHRLAGVLQRGCDRLYARQLKAQQFVLVADGDFPTADPGVTEALAEHFVQWMINPPVVYLRTPGQFEIHSDDDLEVIAGELSPEATPGIRAILRDLVAKRSRPDDWELIVRPQQ